MPGCCPRVPAVNPFDPFSRVRRAKERIANKLANAETNKMIDLSEQQGADTNVKESDE
jgi:hypothetical protein